MIGYWIKKRFIFTALISVIISFVYVLIFVVPYTTAVSDNYLRTSVYEESQISYDIPAPSQSQLEEILSFDFVDEVFGYYITNASLIADGKVFENKLMVSDCVDSIEITMFNEERVIEKTDKTYQYPLFIGKDIAEEYDLNIGDEVVYRDYNLTVAAIYEPDMYRHCILVSISEGDLLDYFEEVSYSYSGAYLKVNDTQKTESFLRSYKPEGRLRDRSDFDSDEAYQIHYDAWAKGSYANEITSFEDKLNDVRLQDTGAIRIGSVAFVALFLVCDIILFLRKSERVYFGTRKSRIGLNVYCFLTFVAETVFALGCMIVTTYMSGIGEKEYISSIGLSKAKVIALSTLILSLVLNYIVNLAMVRRVSNNK